MSLIVRLIGRVTHNVTTNGFIIAHPERLRIETLRHATHVIPRHERKTTDHVTRFQVKLPNAEALSLLNNLLKLRHVLLMT